MVKKRDKNGTKTGHKWDKNGIKTGQKWDNNGIKMDQKWDKNGTGMDEKPKNISKIYLKQKTRSQSRNRV